MNELIVPCNKHHSTSSTLDDMPLTSTSVPVPRNYFLVLYPGHQLLDSAGPLDILSMITKQSSVSGTNITLTILSDSLTKIPLAPVPPRGADWTFDKTPELSVTGGVPGKGFNVPIVPDVTFAQALKDLRESGEVEVEDVYGNPERRSIDVLMIPGGIGSRLIRVDNKTGEKTSNVGEAVDFVREVCENDWVRSALFTVCTGSDILARTGILNGRRATTNFNAFDTVSAKHRDVQWLKGRRFVRSLPDEVNGDQDSAGQHKGFAKEIWTSAGVSAGMDLTLWFAAEVWGKEFARGIARKVEYEWRSQVGEGEVDPYY